MPDNELITCTYTTEIQITPQKLWDELQTKLKNELQFIMTSPNKTLYSETDYW